MAKFIPDTEIMASPTTSKGEPILARRGSEVNKKGEIVEGAYLIDVEDTVKLLSWLAEKAPLLTSTGSLNKSYKEMRTSLIEILEAVSE